MTIFERIRDYFKELNFDDLSFIEVDKQLPQEAKPE